MFMSKFEFCSVPSDQGSKSKTEKCFYQCVSMVIIVYILITSGGCTNMWSPGVTGR